MDRDSLNHGEDRSNQHPLIHALRRGMQFLLRMLGLLPAKATIPKPAGAASPLPPPEMPQTLPAAPPRGTLPKQNVGVLTAAERQESAEHGRTILEFFRNLKLTGKDMQEAMESGTPETQAQLLLQLEGMLEEYDLAMDSALELNPRLMQKKSVKAAEEAAEVLEHAITLLAEKVKPIALSQAQKISADMEEQSPHLHQQDHQNLGRLSEKLADGLSEAFAEAQEQQQEQQQQQDDQREAVEQAVAHHDQLTGRRRRRRGRTSGRGGGGAARRSAGDVQGDGVPDQAQTPRRSAPATAALNPQEVRFKDLNGLLSKEARTLAGALTGGLKVTEVKPGDAVRPDDRTTQEQLAEQIKRERDRNPAKPM